jgi:hypothetical protein
MSWHAKALSHVSVSAEPCALMKQDFKTLLPVGEKHSPVAGGGSPRRDVGERDKNPVEPMNLLNERGLTREATPFLGLFS